VLDLTLSGHLIWLSVDPAAGRSPCLCCTHCWGVSLPWPLQTDSYLCRSRPDSTGGVYHL